MRNTSPGYVVATATFRNEAVYVWIPFQITTKSVEHTDETGNEVFGMINFVEHTENNTSDSREKTVEKISVFKEEVP